MNARILLPITIALALTGLTIAEAKADRYLVFSNTISLNQGEWLQLGWYKLVGVNYQICVTPSYGDADLFAGYIDWATHANYEYSSAKGGTAQDCVDFYNPWDEFYYYSFYGFTDTAFTFHVYEYN
jgi:hypothetical protein